MADTPPLWSTKPRNNTNTYARRLDSGRTVTNWREKKTKHEQQTLQKVDVLQDIGKVGKRTGNKLFDKQLMHRRTITNSHRLPCTTHDTSFVTIVTLRGTFGERNIFSK